MRESRRAAGGDRDQVRFGRLPALGRRLRRRPAQRTRATSPGDACLTKQNGQNVGKIIEIKGVVIDALFTEQLPQIYSALRIQLPERPTGPAVDLIAEVQQHLGDDRVRAVAMDATDGIPRGVDVIDTGGPISVPVGEQTLGRLFNVLGETDRRGRRDGVRRRALADPPRPAELRASCSRRSRSSRPASR